MVLLTAFCSTFNGAANYFLLLFINAGASFFLLTVNAANCYSQASSHHYTLVHKVLMYRMYKNMF